MDKSFNTYALDPNSYSACMNLGNKFLQVGNLSASFSYFQKASELTKDKDELLNCFINRAKCLLLMDNRYLSVEREALYMKTVCDSESSYEAWMAVSYYHKSNKVNSPNEFNLPALAHSKAALNLFDGKSGVIKSDLETIYLRSLIRLNMRDELFDEYARLFYWDSYKSIGLKEVVLEAGNLLKSNHNPFSGLNAVDINLDKFPYLKDTEFNYSQSYQDIFALCVGHITGGNKYLEIGSSDPIHHSNTALLELKGWTGISIDIDKDSVIEFKDNRKNPCHAQDALKMDYSNLGHGTYLSIDIDPANQTYACMRKIIKDGATFDCITIETDYYIDPTWEDPIDELLSKDYEKIANRVEFIEGRPYENWYVSKRIANNKLLDPFRIDSEEAIHIFD